MMSYGARAVNRDSAHRPEGKARSLGLGVDPILVIGCDVGTQSVRASVVDERGTPVAAASVTLPVDHPQPGWAQQDASLWVDALTDVVQRVTADPSVDATTVVGLAVAAQVDAIVPLDERGAPMAAAPIWMDRRATTETDDILRAVDEREIRAITGLNADSSHGGPKIGWLRARYRAAAYVPPTSFIVEWLTGERVMDFANASSLLLWDIGASAW